VQVQDLADPAGQKFYEEFEGLKVTELDQLANVALDVGFIVVAVKVAGGKTIASALSCRTGGDRAR